MNIIRDIQRGVKIGATGDLVTKTMKAITFYQVLHTYKLIHNRFDKMMNIKVVDPFNMNTTM